MLVVANAGVIPNPVLETTVTGESGTVREERALSYVPLVYGTRSVFPVFAPPAVVPFVVPETPVAEVKKVDEPTESVAVETPESAVKTTAPVVVLPEHPFSTVYGYYPYYGLNRYYYGFY